MSISVLLCFVLMALLSPATALSSAATVSATALLSDSAGEKQSKSSPIRPADINADCAWCVLVMGCCPNCKVHSPPPPHRHSPPGANNTIASKATHKPTDAFANCIHCVIQEKCCTICPS